MKRLKFEIIKLPRHFFSNSPVKLSNSERIDLLLINFEESVKEMKRFLQESGYSRRHFFNSNVKISDTFGGKSEAFKKNILMRADELTESEFSKSIITLGSIYRYKEAEALFRVAKLNFPYSSDIFSSMIYSYGKVGEYQEALKLFEDAVINPSIHPNKKMFEALLEAYSVQVEKQLLRASALDERILESSSSIYRQAHSERVLNEISIEPALKIYREMLQLKFSPSISTITRIIRLAGRLKRYSLIEDMQRECERLNLKFDSQAFEVLLFAQMQCCRCEEAEETLKKASLNLEPKDLGRLLNVLLFGYCKLRRPLEVNKLLKQFHKFEIELSPSSISFVIGTFSKCGFIKDAEEYFEKLKLKSMNSFSLIIPAANHLLAAYLRDDNFDKFFSLVDELSSNRDQFTNTMIFEALSRSPKDQNRLSKEIEQTKLHVTRKSLSPMELASLFKCLFTHFEGDDRLIKDFVYYLQQEIKESSEENRKELQMILLDVFAKLGEWDQSINTIESIINIESESRGNHPIDPIIFAKLMTAAGPNPERIEFVFNWMNKLKCWRDPSISTAAMEFYWKAGHSQEARELWEEIKSKRNKAKSFSVAISVMAQILLKEEGPFTALNHLNHYKTLWNDLSVQMYLQAIRLSGTDSSRTVAEFFFEKAIKMNPPPSIEVCNEVLISTLNSKESLSRVSTWMCQSGAHPNVQTINILTNENGNIEIAEKLINEMIKAGGHPSNELLLRMISGQLNLSKELGNPLHLSAETYSNLLLTRPSPSDKIKLNLYTIWYNFFIKSGHFEKAEKIKDEIRKLKIPLDVDF